MDIDNRKALDVLRFTMNKLRALDSRYVVVGSASLALQDVEINVSDVDLATDKVGVYTSAKILGEFMTQEPHYSETEKFCGHIAIYDINGIIVEIFGDTQTKLENKIINYVPTRRVKPVILKGKTFLTMQLEDQLITNILQGRSERVALIERVIVTRGHDKDYLLQVQNSCPSLVPIINRIVVTLND